MQVTPQPATNWSFCTWPSRMRLEYRKKATVLLLALTSLALPTPKARASSQYFASFEDEVRFSQRVFVGIVRRMVVTNVPPRKKTSRRGSSSRRHGLQWPFERLIQFDVEVLEVMKAGNSPVPRKLTVTIKRAYVKEQQIKRDVMELRTRLIDHPRIYLITFGGFEDKGVEHKERVLAALGKRGVRAKKTAEPGGMVILPDSVAPTLGRDESGGQWLN